jgi:hypothetical protein
MSLTAPDFEALRAQRNADFKKSVQRIAAQFHCEPEELSSTFNPNACYCACTSGGPCEHRWDGEPVEEGGLWTTTCSRCAMWAFSHSMRTGE